MTLPQPPSSPRYYPYQPPLPYEMRQPVRTNRVATWDVICTAVAWSVLFMAAAAATWVSLFFAFATDSCSGDCPPVPYGIDNLIYPVTWGGIAVALIMATFGPVVSIWRRWYMFVWPTVALGIVIVSIVAGFAMTAFSARYWH
jgi:hypothetical protein